jgi:hypothetical protein
MNVTPSSATTATGVTSSRPTTKYECANGATASSAENATRWTNATAARRWCAAAVPPSSPASFAVPACVKNAPRAVAAAASSSVSVTSSLPSSVTPANSPTASSA